MVFWRAIVCAERKTELPATASLGAVSPTASLGTYVDLTGSAQLDRLRDGTLIPRGAVEASLEPVSGWVFTVRAGVRRTVSAPGRLAESPVTLGGAFTLDRLSIDLAWEPAPSGGREVEMLTLRIR